MATDQGEFLKMIRDKLNSEKLQWNNQRHGITTKKNKSHLGTFNILKLQRQLPVSYWAPDQNQSMVSKHAKYILQ